MNRIPSVYVPSVGDYIEVMSGFECYYESRSHAHSRHRIPYTLCKNKILYVSKIRNNGEMQVMDVDVKTTVPKYITSADFHKVRKVIKDHACGYTGQLLCRAKAAKLNRKVGYYVHKVLNWTDGQRIFEIITSYLTIENLYNNPRIGDQVTLVKRMKLEQNGNIITLCCGTEFEIEELNADGTMKMSYDLEREYKNLLFPTRDRYARYCQKHNVENNLEITNISCDGQITAVHVLTSVKYLEWPGTMCYYLQ